MNPRDFEKLMRAGECFHSLRLMPGAWTVIRVDGRSFTRFTSERFDKPFDERFRNHMTAAAEALMREMNGIYAFTESDEISVLFPPRWEMFDRELEKLVSVAAGIASAAFTLSMGESAHFDARVWLGSDVEAVADYFMWRHFDAARCCLNGWAYWTMRNAGSSYAEASKELEKRTAAWKNELLFRHGTNFNDVPNWQKRGVGVYWADYEIDGLNPVTGTPTVAVRRRLKVDLELPMKDAYRAFVLAQLAGQPADRPVAT
jgi:tRNA(His) guanylyltransferase